MAKQFSGIDISLLMGADLSAKANHFVEMSANDTVTVCNAITDVPLGVLQVGAATSQAGIVRITGHTKVKAAEVLAAGNLVGTHTDGTALVVTAGTSTTAYIAGVCTKGANTGEIAEIVLLSASRAVASG
jgi:hypothetical protein